MFLGVHAKVILGEAARSMCMVEGAVAAVEDVNFWEREQRVLVSILFTVLGSNKLGPG
jgi:hypothetical protein